MASSAMIPTRMLAGSSQTVSSEIVAVILKNSSSTGALLHRTLLEKPYSVDSASGSYLVLRDGRRILDGCGGAAVAVIGHGSVEVMQATITQMKKVSYVHTMAYTTDAAEHLAEFLLNDPKSSFEHGLEKAYFVGSGSEANDASMKMARQYFYEQGQKQRRYFVSRRQAYHGNTLGAMSISSNVPRKEPYEGALTLPYVSFVSPAYAYQYKKESESEEDYVQMLVAEIETEFLRLGPENVIGFMAEPVVGATAGCVPSPKGYFPAVRKLCDRHGILLMLDEVMCGMGRTGTFFAFEQENVVPDIVTIGKGLGGGYAPVAGILVHKKVIDVLRSGTSAFNHGHTYQAHPVTCATALKVQQIIRRDSLVERCSTMGLLLESLLREQLGSCKYVGDIRGRGLFWGVEFVQNKKNKTSFDMSVKFGLKVQRAAFDLGVALYPGSATVDGYRGDHVLIAPPYNVTEEDLKTIVRILREAYNSQEAYEDSR